MADFRSWLCALPADAAPLPIPEDEGPDLHTLLGQFVALRHDVNLQTKATRAQQEQTAETVALVRGSLDRLEAAESAAREAQEAATEQTLRPLLKALVDLYDALAIAGREVQRVEDSLVDLLDQMAPAAEKTAEKEQRDATPLPEAPAVPWWRRLFGGRAVLSIDAVGLRDELHNERRLRAEQAAHTRAIAQRVRQAVSSLVTGYEMSLQRVERALRQHDLETIATVGEPFDPERMEVVDAVLASGRPGGEVLEEVRRGYLWNGRIFRYAQVRVAKSG